jgi:serine/threonine-protein kinase
MAQVRAGWDLRLGQAVAVKTLLPGPAEGRVGRGFAGEAAAAGRPAHPNAVAVFDVGEDAGVAFLVMEQVAGPTLARQLADGLLGAERVRRLSEDLLAALGAAHAAGVVHRDVKPSNILMARDGSAKVADFGIALTIADEEASVTPMDLVDTGQTLVDVTAAGETVGTLAYMASERRAGRPATVQSDLYSVGVVLFEALTGARPSPATTPTAVAGAITQAPVVPRAQPCPGLDGALIIGVERAMAQDPADRFASATEMAVALGQAAEMVETP